MKCVDLTFADPAQNLAFDEALLECCEQQQADGVLRLWEPQNYFVVLGYSNKVATEVNVSACQANGIAILRRFSGGGAVLQGPGCLNYALVTRNQRMGVVGDLTESYNRVLKRHQTFFQKLTSEAVLFQGNSDLTISGYKFSGNAQHRRHRYALVHGTFLLSFDLALVETCLPMPSRQPTYRQNRSHGLFLRNLFIDSATIREGLKKEWAVEGNLQEVPYDRINELVSQRYSRFDWSRKF
jgi:lipoate---protein ligase